MSDFTMHTPDPGGWVAVVMDTSGEVHRLEAPHPDQLHAQLLSLHEADAIAFIDAEQWGAVTDVVRQQGSVHVELDDCEYVVVTRRRS